MLTIETDGIKKEAGMSAQAAAARMWRAAGGDDALLDRLVLTGAGDLPSRFAVSDLAVAAVGTAALAVAELVGEAGGRTVAAQADRRLASLWFGWSLQPIGWTPADAREPFSGDYTAADGWVRLHMSGVGHRAAARRVLGEPADRAEAERAISRWPAAALEAAVVEAGGCVAEMRALDAWGGHSQGQAVAAEPLIERSAADAVQPNGVWRPNPARPLSGLRVLDLTRILAGPIATRFLAGFGAKVLRIDPLVWDEPGVIPEVALGKRCARLDLASVEGRLAFEALLSSADILVHGYRPEALEWLGLGAARRREIAPGLIDVALDAYGWSGPWAGRRGFDSLVQMSSGIADAGMRWRKTDRPAPLPVQALDHATGYLMAAAAVRGVTERLRSGRGGTARLSLARTAHELIAMPPGEQMAMAPKADDDFAAAPEQTCWGPARRLRPPVVVGDAPMAWDNGARALGSDPAAWW